MASWRTGTLTRSCRARVGFRTFGLLIPLPRFRTSRPIPLYDERGHQVRVVKPGTEGVIVGEFNGSGPGASTRIRAMVRFDGDPEHAQWDVDRAALWVEEGPT